jgi:class 3 adenylate cyclase
MEADEISLPTTSTPDGTVTIVFTDIENSTHLNVSFGDKAWFEVLRAHNDLVAKTTREHGGTVVKNSGDGFMLAFSSSRRALNAAVAMQVRMLETFTDPGSPIKIRVGMHVGEVLNEADDIFGSAVNYAARVASSARGGEIVVSGLVHQLVESTGEYEFAEPREAVFKGIESPQIVYPLHWAVDHPSSNTTR